MAHDRQTNSVAPLKYSRYAFTSHLSAVLTIPQFQITVAVVPSVSHILTIPGLFSVCIISRITRLSSLASDGDREPGGKIMHIRELENFFVRWVLWHSAIIILMTMIDGNLWGYAAEMAAALALILENPFDYLSRPSSAPARFKLSSGKSSCRPMLLARSCTRQMSYPSPAASSLLLIRWVFACFKGFLEVRPDFFKAVNIMPSKGRIVGKLPAVIARPCSTADHMAKYVVASTFH
jgi:hypothetical protein